MGSGGMTLNVTSTVKLTSVNVIGNVSTAGDGGLEIIGASPLVVVITGGLYEGNTGALTGGIAIDGSYTATIAKATITENVGSSPVRAGGIAAQAGSTVVLSHDKIFGNVNLTTPANADMFGTFS